jgi:diguanylate cyclase (GGDEF)-like protein
MPRHHLSPLNDTHGHDSGDRALRLFAAVLQASVRKTDLVARFGGEEFVMLLQECDESAARGLLDQLRQRLVESTARYGGPKFTASFGVACTDGVAPLDELVKRADAALYQAKRSGRDRVCTMADLQKPVLVEESEAAAV